MTRWLAAAAAVALAVFGLAFFQRPGRAPTPARITAATAAPPPARAAEVVAAQQPPRAVPAPPRWSAARPAEPAAVPPSKARATLARRVRWTTEVLGLGPGEAIALERIAATLEDARDAIDRRREARALDPVAADAAIEAVEQRAEQELAALVGPDRHARLLDLWDRAPPGDDG